MTDEQRRFCLRIIDHYGAENQKRKALEELAELMVEITHELDGRPEPERIREELADVIIMCEQMRIIYGGRDVDAWIENKLARMERRIAGEGDMAQGRETTSSGPSGHLPLKGKAFKGGGTYGNV